LAGGRPAVESSERAARAACGRDAEMTSGARERRAACDAGGVMSEETRSEIMKRTA
jgi:hypothetical protein